MELPEPSRRDSSGTSRSTSGGAEESTEDWAETADSDEGVAPSAGCGLLRCERDGGQCRVSRISAHYPLKLMHAIDRHCCERPAAAAALPGSQRPWHAPPAVQLLTYGGGVLGCDWLRLRVELLPASCLLLTTPSHGRLYRQRAGCSGGETAKLSQDFRLAASSLLLYLPSPVSAFASSAVVSRSTVRLQASASVALLDCLTAGRQTLAESFQSVRRYEQETEVLLQSRPPRRLLRERLVIAAPAAGLLPHRCQASLLLLGPQLLPAALRLFLLLSQRTVRKDEPAVLLSASWVGGHVPAAASGAGAGEEAEAEVEAEVARLLRLHAALSAPLSGGCLLRLSGDEVCEIMAELGRVLDGALDCWTQGLAPWQRI